MQLERTTLLTILMERILESELKRLVEEAGAPGYTIMTAHGKGRHGDRAGPTQIADNAQMTVVAPRAIAHAILRAIEKDYARSYAIMAFIQDVDAIQWTPAPAAGP